GDVVSPPPNSPSGPVLIVSHDDTIRAVDPNTHALSTPVQLGAGPHSVLISGGNAMMPPQVFVTNAGDGTVSVLDQAASSVQTTLQVGGRPVGVARTVDDRLWVADGDSGDVNVFDPESGTKQDSMQVGPKLTALASTPDGRFLVLASSDPQAALY